ncbi:hypothetical protein VPH35_028576 [Triticum aestivum]
MLRALCRSMEVRGAAWRPRRHGEEAAEDLRGGGFNDTHQHGNKPWRRAGHDWCMLWMRTGRVGRVGTAGARTSVWLTLGGGVCRRCARVHAQVRLHPSGVCRWRLPWRTRRRRAVSVWCGRARRARRVRADVRDAPVRSGLSGASGARETCGTHWCGQARRGASGVRGTCGAPKGRQTCVAGEDGIWSPKKKKERLQHSCGDDACCVVRVECGGRGGGCGNDDVDGSSNVHSGRRACGGPRDKEGTFPVAALATASQD